MDFVSNSALSNHANQLSLSNDNSTLTVKMSVADLSATGLATAFASTGGQYLSYITRWQMGDTIWYAGVENPNPTTGSTLPQFFAGPAQSIDLCSVSGCTPHVLTYPEGTLPAGTTPNVALGHIETGGVSCPTSPSATNPCTVTITVNATDVGSPTQSSLLEEVGSYSFASVHPQAALTNASSNPSVSTPE